MKLHTKLKMEYFKLPIQTTALEFVYRLSYCDELGKTNDSGYFGGWTTGKISVAGTLVKANGNVSSLERFALGQAKVLKANYDGQPLGDIAVNSLDSVDLIEYKTTGSKYDEIKENIDGKPFQFNSDLDSDILKAEYVHLPKIDDDYYCLFRFVEPMQMVWMARKFANLRREIVIARDGHLKQFNRHVSVEEAVRMDVPYLWDQIFKESEGKEDPSGVIKKFKAYKAIEVVKGYLA